MPQIACVHCTQTLDSDSAQRKGSMVICPSCSGQMYMPHVQERKAVTQQAGSTPQQHAAPRRTAPPIGARNSSKASRVSSGGVGITFLILGIILFGGGGLTIAGYFVYKSSIDRISAKEERQRAAQSAEVKLKALAEKAVPQGPREYTEPTRKDLETIKNAVVAFLEATQENEEDYNDDLANAGLRRLLTADRVAKDTDFDESRKMLVDIRAVIDRYRSESMVPLELMIEELSAATFESVPKEEFIERVRVGLVPMQKEMERLWDLELGIFQQYEQAIKHLEATRGKWKLEGESLTFTDVKDAERYKQFFNEVDKRTQKQVDMVQKYAQYEQWVNVWLKDE